MNTTKTEQLLEPSGFTSYEHKFGRQDILSKLKLISLASSLICTFALGLYLTLSSLGQMNSNIAGVFEQGDMIDTIEEGIVEEEFQQEVYDRPPLIINKGPVETALQE